MPKHDVAVPHLVDLALDARRTVGAGFRNRARLEAAAGADHRDIDEALLEVGVDETGRREILALLRIAKACLSQGPRVREVCIPEVSKPGIATPRLHSVVKPM
jgi:hypothetical protein